MQKQKKLSNNLLNVAVAAAGVFTASAVHAEEGAFNNFLLRSPSIISPSQNYQVKAGRFEGYLGALTGTFEPKAAGAKNVDISGTEIGAAAQYAVSPMAVIGVDVDYLNTKVDDTKANSTEISPAVALTLTPLFSLGLGAHLVSGTVDSGVAGANDENTSFNYFTVGATLHQDLWEATLVYNTKNKDDNKPQNNSPSRFGIHGRYRLMPALALGLSFRQSDTSALAPSGANVEDETQLGLHVESQFSEVFSGDFAFLSTSNTDGAKGDDSSELVALLQFKVNPTMEIGGRLSYLTSSSDVADASVIRPGVFLTSYF